MGGCGSFAASKGASAVADAPARSEQPVMRTIVGPFTGCERPRSPRGAVRRRRDTVIHLPLGSGAIDAPRPEQTHGAGATRGSRPYVAAWVFRVSVPKDPVIGGSRADAARAEVEPRAIRHASRIAPYRFSRSSASRALAMPGSSSSAFW